MSQLSQSLHNFEDVLAGKATFTQFRDEEVAMFRADVAKLPAAVQPIVNLGVASLEAGASKLVGIGETAVGPLLARSSPDQADMVLNLMRLAGVPTAGPLSIAEHAVLVTMINGLKAGLDRIGVHLTTTLGVTDPTAPAMALAALKPAAAPAAPAVPVSAPAPAPAAPATA